MLHHLTRAFVLSAVFRCVLSLTTMYCCSSLTCATSSDSCRTVLCQITCARRSKPSRTLLLQWVLRCLRLRHVYDSVHIERHLLRVCGPVLVAEAVHVSAVLVGGEGMVAGGNAAFEDLVRALRILYLPSTVNDEVAKIMNVARTQKSISRLPLPPNSLSPTWKVTVILSSAWRASWKHSRECDLSWMLCAATTPTRPRKAV